MTKQKNILDVFNNKTPERLPWAADLSWWLTTQKAHNKLPEKYEGAGELQLHIDLDAAIYLPPCNPYDITTSCKLIDSEKDGKFISRIETPYGELTEVIGFMPETATHSHDQRLLKSADDLRALTYYIESLEYVPNLEFARRREDLFGDFGTVILAVPRTPLSRMMVEYAGVENTIYAMMDAGEEFDNLIKVMKETDDAAYDIVKQAAGTLVMFPDNLSSELISPSYFKKYTMEYYQTRSDELRAAGKFTMTHLDGTLNGLLQLMAEAGLDCVEGITPHPVGDISPEKLRELAGDDIIIWGGLPGGLFGKEWPVESFEEYIHKYIQMAAENPRFIIGVGDQVPPHADLFRVRRVSEIIDEIV